MFELLIAWIVDGLLGLRSEIKVLQPSPSPISRQIVQSFAGGYGYRYFEVTDASGLQLIYNYENKIDASELIQRNLCQNAINGGFYDTNFKPLGLVVTNSLQLSDNRVNKLFNGYLYVLKNGRVQIADRPIFANIKEAMQTGPLLYLSGEQITLSDTVNHARRMVAIELGEGKIIFGTIFSPQSVLDGPTLSELPDILEAMATKEGWRIEAAVNLDGGSASVYYTGGELIREWQPVGSLWCLK